MAREFIRLNAQQAVAKDSILYADVIQGNATLYLTGGNALPTNSEVVQSLGLSQINNNRWVAWDRIVMVEITATSAEITLDSGDSVDVGDDFASQIAARAGLR